MSKLKMNFINALVVIFIAVSLLINFRILFTQSIRLDEAQSLWVATKTVSGILQYIVLDVHVPLYELILHFWLQIFGASIFYARLLSFIFFLLTIPILYILARSVTNRNIALLTIIFYSLSPFMIWFSLEARMYSLFTFIVCINHIYFLQILKSKGKKGDVGYFFTTFFGLYTHYFYLLLLVSQFFFLLFYFFSMFIKQKSSFSLFWGRRKNEVMSFVIPVLLAVVLFVPWLVYFKIQGLAAFTQPLIPVPTTYDLFQIMVNFIFGFQSQFTQSILVALWPLAVIPLFFLFSQREDGIDIGNMNYFILVTILPIVLVFVISFVKPIFLSRYLIFVIPTFFLLLSWGLLQISKNKSVVVLTLFAILMFVFLLYQNISTQTPVKEDYLGVDVYLNSHATAQDVIAVSAPFTIYPVEYYYKGSAGLVTVPEWDLYKSGAIPKYSRQALKNQIADYTKIYKNIYIVLSYNQGYEEDIKYFMDHSYQRILLKKFSPGLELREYRLQYSNK